MKRCLYLCAGLGIVAIVIVSLTLPTALMYMRVSQNLGSWRAVVYDDQHRVIGEGHLDLRVQDWKAQLGLHYPMLRIDPQLIQPAGKIRLSDMGVVIVNSYGDSFSHQEYELIHPSLNGETIGFRFSEGGSGNIVVIATLSGQVGTGEIYWARSENGIQIPVFIEFGR
jgi:hypothetical protein